MLKEKDPLPCSEEISSWKAKNGTFTSPNYPEPYPPRMHCIYTFAGLSGERVQITFTDFDLHLPHEPPRGCESVDAVMIFITINGRRERLESFCGNKLPRQLMSNGPSLVLDFRTYHSSPEVKGFRAIYRFVTDYGVTATTQHQGTACEFIFKSEERSNGTFSSPNYPGYYPRDTECVYVFKGREKERVQITFTSFEIDGIPPCLEETASDYVEFSNFKTTDRKIPRHCGSQRPKYIESDSSYFRITFMSNEKFDGTGFQAFYEFKKQEDPSTVKRISTTSISTSSKSAALGMDSIFSYVLPAVFCALWFLMV
ncbi:Suppressor of lurcher protein 1, partial [Stegodyphus mimosarum]